MAGSGTAEKHAEDAKSKLTEAELEELLQQAIEAEAKESGTDKKAGGGSESASAASASKTSIKKSSQKEQVRIRREWVRGLKVPPLGLDPPEDPPAEKYIGCYVLVPYTRSGQDDPTYFGGIVAEYSPFTRLFVVEYDDGEVTEHDLAVEMHVITAYPHQHGGRAA